MNITSSERARVAHSVSYLNPSASGDLLDPEKTTDDLVRMLGRIVDAGFKPLLTALRSDHGDDSCLGPHGHAHGYAVDLWVNPVICSRLLQACATDNHYCTKIGLGGIFATYMPEFTHGSTIVFCDNDQDHIHLQTA